MARTLQAQQPALKWNPPVKKLVKLNARLAKMNEALNKRNSAITDRLKEAFPNRYDSLVRTLYQVGPQEGKLAVLQEEFTALTESIEFARGQEGTNELFQKVKLASAELELLQSQAAFLKNLSASGLSLDSLGLKKDWTAAQKEVGAYSGLLDQYRNTVKDLGSSLEAYAINHPKVAAFKKEYETLKELERQNLLKRSDTTGLQTHSVVQQAIGRHFGIDAASVNAFVGGRIAEANEELSQLKQQYDRVHDSNQITRQEKNPLAGLPLAYRLIYDGNLSLNRGDLTTMDSQLSLGYRLNPRMSLGLGFNKRWSLGQGWDQIDVRDQGWGYRAWYDYRLNRSFFLQASYERLRAQRAPEGNAENASIWRYGGLLGLGRFFSLGNNSEASLVILYNLINQKNSQFDSPWVLRFGLKLNKKNR